jgi:hypothetical protein
MAFFQKPPWEKCWAAVGCGWAMLGFGQGEERGKGRWAEPKEREERALSLFFFLVSIFFQINSNLKSV